MFTERIQYAVLLVLFSSVSQLILYSEGQSSGDLRLVSNSGSTVIGGSSGRLEVYYSGQWGTVCNDLFGSNDARVACRQLGFLSYSSYGSVGSLGFNQGSSFQRTWLDNLGCTGTESRLSSCRHNGYGVENCGHSQDVGLRCSLPSSSGGLRLVSNSGSTGGSSGRLEIYYSGQWGTVCDDSFGANDARVACRQLGFSSYSSYGSVGRLGFSQGSSSQRTWLDNLGCSGSESRLSSCRHNGYGVEDCDHSEDVGLRCSSTSSGGSGSSGSGGSNTVTYGSAGGSSFIIILVICCCICGCCGAAKRRRRTVLVTPTVTTAQPQTTVVTTNVTNMAVIDPNAQGPYPAYPTNQPMQAQPVVNSTPAAYPPSSTAAYPPEPAKTGLYPDAPPPYPPAAPYPANNQV